MANGFRALRTVTGGAQQLTEYPLASAYGTSIYNGDLVKLVGGNVELATNADANVGVFVGVMYVNAQGEQKFSPMWTAGTVGTDIRVLVSADVGITYKVEVSAGTNQAGVTGAVVPAAGDDRTGQSRETFNADGVGTQATIRTVLPSEGGKNYAEVVFTSVMGV